MPEEILLSTAYLPPSEYLSKIKDSEKVLIEGEENYIKQTFRNRCYILAPGGVIILSVPVYKGPALKTPIKFVRIDYSKRWQQVHLRALVSSYSTSPYFEFYYDKISEIILKNHEYLFDLNMDLLGSIMNMLKITREISITKTFQPIINGSFDFRYKLSPKIQSPYSTGKFSQTFNNETFKSGLSIVDLIFNTGPDAIAYL